MKEIRKRIFSIKTDSPVNKIRYLALDVEETVKPVKIKLINKTKYATLETFRINSKVPKSIIADLNYLHGVSAIDLIKSSLESECNILIEKNIVDIMRFAGEENNKLSFTKFQSLLNNWTKYTPKKRIKTDQDIPLILLKESRIIQGKTRRGPVNYIIVSAGLAARIQQTPQFTPNDPNQPQLEQNTGLIYKIGKIGHILEILVDPKIEFSNMQVIMGANTMEKSEGLYMFYKDPVIYKNDSQIGDEHESLTLEQRMSLTVTDNAHLNYLTFEFTDKPHNIFTHLWNKILTKK